MSAFFENGEEAEVEEVPVDRPAEAPEPMEEASGRESGEQSRVSYSVPSRQQCLLG